MNLLIGLLIIGVAIGGIVVGYGGLKQVLRGEFKQGFKTIGKGVGIFVVTVIIIIAIIEFEKPTPEEKVKQEQLEKIESEQQAKLEAEQKAKEEAEKKAEAERQAKEEAIIQDLMYIEQQYSGRAKVHKYEEEHAFIVEFNDKAYMTTIVQQANVGNTVAREMFNQEVEIAANVSKGINPVWKIRVVTGEYSMWRGYTFHIEVQAGKSNK
ncbi:hypothetical protein [Mesobacillus maritimus]|uniref:DUF1510 domain-containing protein n=1 Tax=Mesobacillus maritimus TaxID=1643336 RepID=A0ABS7K987_9BACI|nr:hypothetical protein [Mesobacillus maritimus]MBY0098783.1 hypothetical protein [Mesobacillus maritimus]